MAQAPGGPSPFVDQGISPESRPAAPLKPTFWNNPAAKKKAAIMATLFVTLVVASALVGYAASQSVPGSGYQFHSNAYTWFRAGAQVGLSAALGLSALYVAYSTIQKRDTVLHEKDAFAAHLAKVAAVTGALIIMLTISAGQSGIAGLLSGGVAIGAMLALSNRCPCKLEESIDLL